MYKAVEMRKLIIYLFISLFLAGCKGDRNISFCEGVTPEGKGVNCGIKFSTGELTALITSKDPFETEKLYVSILAVKKQRTDKVETITVDVKPEDERATVNLSLYNEGKFQIKVTGKENKVIGEGDIEIVDTY